MISRLFLILGLLLALAPERVQIMDGGLPPPCMPPTTPQNCPEDFPPKN